MNNYSDLIRRLLIVTNRAATPALRFTDFCMLAVVLAALSFTSCVPKPERPITEEELKELTKDSQPQKWNYRTASAESVTAECWTDGWLSTPVSYVDLNIVIKAPESLGLRQAVLEVEVKWQGRQPTVLRHQVTLGKQCERKRVSGSVEYTCRVKNLFQNDLEKSVTPVGDHEYRVLLRIDELPPMRFKSAVVSVQHLKY